MDNSPGGGKINFDIQLESLYMYLYYISICILTIVII